MQAGDSRVRRWLGEEGPRGGPTSLASVSEQCQVPGVDLKDTLWAAGLQSNVCGKGEATPLTRSHQTTQESDNPRRAAVRAEAQAGHMERLNAKDPSLTNASAKYTQKELLGKGNMTKIKICKNTSLNFLLLNSIGLKSLHPIAINISHFCTYLLVDGTNLCPPATDSTLHSTRARPYFQASEGHTRSWEAGGRVQIDPGTCLLSRTGA